MYARVEREDPGECILFLIPWLTLTYSCSLRFVLRPVLPSSLASFRERDTYFSRHMGEIEDELGDIIRAAERG